MGSDTAFPEPFYGSDKKKDKKEKCVLCGDDTPYTINTHIDMRRHYIEGAGQLCSKCFEKIYNDMTVYILGVKGMLGRYVETYFKSKGYRVIGFTRNEIDASKVHESQLRLILSRELVKRGDVLINCMGAIKPKVDDLGTLNAIKVNSVFPYTLANVCEEMGLNLIHVSTDCVFSGYEGNYNENSIHDAIDIYGKSKSLGEPENCTVIRTSIIGEELETKRSLIEWVKSEDGNTVNGFLNHQWNGLTCHQTAKVFEQIIKENHFWKGVRHIHSPNSLNKYELVKEIAKAHHLKIKVNPIDAPIKCDRSLSTIYDDIDFKIPDIQTQLVEQVLNPPVIDKKESQI